MANKKLRRAFFPFQTRGGDLARIIVIFNDPCTIKRAYKAASGEEIPVTSSLQYQFCEWRMQKGRWACRDEEK